MGVEGVLQTFQRTGGWSDKNKLQFTLTSNVEKIWKTILIYCHQTSELLQPSNQEILRKSTKI